MKAILIAAILAAGTAHAQTSWKPATGYRAESFHTRNLYQFAQDVEKNGYDRSATRPTISSFRTTGSDTGPKHSDTLATTRL